MVSLADAEAALGPSMRQTVIAALAGPALVAVGACVVAVLTWRGGAAPSLTPATAKQVVYLSARPADVKRLKAPSSPPEKAEKPPRK
jgi:hypothetical protein